MCLLKVDGYIRGVEYSFDNVMNDENKALLDGLLAGFDPYTNEEIRDAIQKICDLNAPDEVKAYFETPVKCLLRIEKSVELWTKNLGTNGYFSFIEESLGKHVKDDEKMNFSILLPGEDAMEKLGLDPLLMMPHTASNLPPG